MHIQFSPDPQTVTLFLKLAVAMLCGMFLGTERLLSHKAAGMRTYALVSMGAALFVMTGDLIFTRYGSAFAPSAIMQGIITGIGFMGAGVIIFRDSNVVGLTTASGLWVASGIGMASGFGLYTLAVLATLLSLFVFIVLWHVEQAVRKYSFVMPDDRREDGSHHE